MKRAITIYYDEDSMEFMKVDIAPVFENETPLARADVLKDCVEVTTALYNESVDELIDEFESMARENTK